MQNQKLFDKIRTSLTDEEALEQEPLEWSTEDVWQKIEQRQHQNRKLLWWPFAAAAALVICMGGYVWFWAVTEVEKPMIKRVITVEKDRGIKSALNVPTKNKKADSKPLYNLHKSETIAERKKETQDTFIVANPSTAPVDVKSTPEQDSVLTAAVATEIPPIVENNPVVRVLVVDIDLPDAPPVAEDMLKTTFLQRFSQQARRLRTERKFDIKALDRKPGAGIWSFVGQSFVTPDVKH
ncbi:hypothetical protein [Runella aurantiaca]|uniref:Uncharacterized protein n=1 Tax=Runella aurantiaca TaxID=2282308 RepID=A0A369I5Q4_9BACT|nr:hypothetical protein [Runella aurantiaca]RDB04372.1 hypothetical protein DVG78_19450 [Runella aurantiaca]